MGRENPEMGEPTGTTPTSAGRQVKYHIGQAGNHEEIRRDLRGQFQGQKWGTHVDIDSIQGGIASLANMNSFIKCCEVANGSNYLILWNRERIGTAILKSYLEDKYEGYTPPGLVKELYL